ncbi:glycosyl hydrolases family 38 N-terminal domain-domain-containing protein [Syncephalastrum racemosum]|uniref:Alpha-mannosidase n=1 Tax=Syncephalastrum racemosum TaxID=13706 RepID=A0A1X2HCG4_SYNRA|nr:glycosyl hydrolases family 38 N-terminal domain-domain-containing protein [Syncephalastrum racemosum]
MLHTLEATHKPPIDATPRVPVNLTHSRVDNFMSDGGIFHSMGIHRALWQDRHSGAPHVVLSVYDVPDLKRITFKEAVAQTFQKVGQHERKYGPSWATHWFKVELTIPDALDGKRAVLQWDMGCEGMVWTTDGIPLQGLTGQNDQARHEFIVTERAKAGQTFTFYIEAACNGMFGVGDSGMVPQPDRHYTIKTADLVSPNYAVQDLYHDLTIIRGIAYDTVQESVRAREALWVVNQCINLFRLENPESVQQCKKITSDFLSVKNGDAKGQHQITAVGNCHIDTAWLWPYDETKRKIARSWSTQVDLMDRYPEYIFTGSQAQQYEWLRELYPPVFEKIQKKEKTGQWEIIGGSWVEHDTNMPSGESLCRQMVLGQRYFEKHFGKRVKIFWLPDSFGYSSQLPQILRLSGCDYFFTQKLSWNNINKFPLSTFWWQGIDGTNILAHLTPADTYTAVVSTSEVYKCVKNHHDLEVSNKSLLCYGHGDGGGGPTPEMIERVRRMKDVDGLPMVKAGSALDFFESLEASERPLQSYNGELYLEFHRGTYTTQGLVKQGNRKSEVLIRDVEMLGVMATVGSASSYSYPLDDLDRIWKLLCLNQFHDCLPGSAIGLAYKDVHKHHREIISDSLKLRHKAQNALLTAVGARVEDGQEAENENVSRAGMVVFNTLSWPRMGVLAVPDKGTSWQGQQSTKDGHELVLVQDVPAMGAAGYEAKGHTVPRIEAKDAAKAYKTDDGSFVLENPNLKAIFNKDGQLIQLTDKNEPDRLPLVPKHSLGNVLQLYEDVPTYWDAWDVEIYHLQKCKTIQGSGNLEIISEGPLKAELRFRQEISDKSHIEQTISLTCVAKRIEFSNFVDWHEAHQFLKTEFVWDILSDHATYEIQYGALRRPTHYNSTVDSAKFEVCGHRFADLSDANYGVALLNNCKYGYATHGNTQRLSLLRSPKGPDENADMGQHHFKYAIYPHRHHFNASNVAQEAMDFNTPLSVRCVRSETPLKNTVVRSLFQVEPNDRIILDHVKLAEDDKGAGKTIIVRLYEAYGGQATAKLTSSLNIREISITNVLEDTLTQKLASDKDGGYQVTLRPFQLLNLKIHL